MAAPTRERSIQFDRWAYAGWRGALAFAEAGSAHPAAIRAYPASLVKYPA